MMAEGETAMGMLLTTIEEGMAGRPVEMLSPCFKVVSGWSTGFAGGFGVLDGCGVVGEEAPLSIELIVPARAGVGDGVLS